MLLLIYFQVFFSIQFEIITDIDITLLNSQNSI